MIAPRHDSKVTESGYDKSAVTPGIVHFGPSHFARAHWFRIIDDYMSRTGDLNWGILAVNIPSKTRADHWPRYQELRDQGCDYHLLEQGLHSEDKNVVRRISALLDILRASADADAVAEAIANPNIRLITSTVTQKGYDVTTNIDEPTMAYYIVRGLELRYNRGLSGLTIMSLDNLVDNGSKLKDTVIAQAAGNPGLQRWIAKNAVFPSTMVDRITPSTIDPAESARISDALDIKDAWPVRTEEMLQLVIARQPGCALPPIDSVQGLATVSFTKNVHAYELMKLRMLNGAHMALGVIGQLMGYKVITEALADERVSRFARAFMSEAASSLPALDGVNYEEYQKTNFQRFVRLDPPDELARLSRNGSQDKLDPRVLGTARDLIAQGKDFRCMAFAAAAWAHFLRGVDVNGQAFDINDAHAVSKGWQDIARTKPAAEIIVLLRDIFGQDLSQNRRFQSAFQRQYNLIKQLGMGAALDAVTGDNAPDTVTPFRPNGKPQVFRHG